MYVPSPVDAVGGHHLLKPHAPNPIVNAICKANDVVIDVGANIGHWTLAAARVVGERGRVLAFEPVPRMAAALRKTVAANRLTQVKVFELALAEAAETRDFSVERENTGGSRLDRLSDDARRTFDHIAVTTARFDDIAEAEKVERVDIFKIDVEGFEYGVLRGAHDQLRRCKPIIFMETGHESEECRIGIHEILSGLGYRVLGVSIGQGMLEATLDEYRLRKGVFSDVALADILLMP